MKNLFTSIILFIGAGILLSSCSHGSLTKRHYRNGYYFSHANKPSTPKSKESEAVYAKKTIIAPEQITEPVVEEEVFASVEIKNETQQISKNSNYPSLTKTAGLKPGIEKSISHASVLDAEINTPTTFFQNKSQSKKVSTPTGGDALSLFWLVIMIIIIIWFIAFLGGGWGLGGLINLLLIIALILLILWLLRLI